MWKKNIFNLVTRKKCILMCYLHCFNFVWNINWRWQHYFPKMENVTYRSIRKSIFFKIYIVRRDPELRWSHIILIICSKSQWLYTPKSNGSWWDAKVRWSGTLNPDGFKKEFLKGTDSYIILFLPFNSTNKCGINLC